MATRSFARWPTEFKHDLKTENGNRKSENSVETGNGGGEPSQPSDETEETTND